MSIDVLKDRLPEYARDLKLNLSSLASEQLLSPQQKAGSFIAAALAANHVPTTQAVVDAFGPELTPEALNAAKIAASLMAMNNIYYRFVHLVHAADYKTLPAKLRMTAMAKPGVDKVDFELWSLVVSAINGCGMCLEAAGSRSGGRARPATSAHPRRRPSISDAPGRPGRRHGRRLRIAR
jgi:alkyl hydroperoxide reductase subunit D